VVERGPEKAGVGGSIPSLATTYIQILTRIVAIRAKPTASFDQTLDGGLVGPELLVSLIYRGI
jgi:hypothetical protein